MSDEPIVRVMLSSLAIVNHELIAVLLGSAARVPRAAAAADSGSKKPRVSPLVAALTVPRNWRRSRV